ncbi:MAG: class aldolase/adducin family protein [Clostridia bacterium]|jgi:L-ribulose-5-phosphate 4-epimerase|nr:class aldolase/adducin family protein [Clostridia bacterium]
MLLQAQRQKVIEIALKAQRDKLIPLTMGNFSIRDKDTGYVCITPSGMEYSLLQPADIVIVDLYGTIIDGNRKPSIETQLHCRTYAKRADVFGICHTHSPYATAWACCGKEIPVIVAELAGMIGGPVKCAPYAPMGTIELANIVAEHIGSQNAVLLENHGMLAVGENIDQAYANAVVVEEGAKVTLYAVQIGGMKTITDQECKNLKKQTMESYGQK